MQKGPSCEILGKIAQVGPIDISLSWIEKWNVTCKSRFTAAKVVENNWVTSTQIAID